MKNILLSLNFVAFITSLPLHAESTVSDPSRNGPDCISAESSPPIEKSWAILHQESEAMAIAIKKKDTHSLHKLDGAIGQETLDLQKKDSALPLDQTKKLNDLLSDIAKQATTAHHDAHAAKWDDAAAAQAQLGADLKAAQALFSSKE